MKPARKMDWITASFLLTTPIAAIVLVAVHLWFFSFSAPLLVLAVFFAAATNMSITAGYHRLFAHRSYQARPWVRALFLFWGAGAFQGPALKWATDHRRHHRHVDTNQDPYTITKGFWFAHIGWLFFEDSDEYRDKFATDLKNDWMVRFQHRHYVLIASFVAFGLPTFGGWLLGDAFGGLVYAGLVRLVLCQHSTFFINSLCHMWGRRTYSDKVTARDNFVLALLTYGEGYHNFHHSFEGDYRNGVKWYHWDPTKWMISGMAWIGLAHRRKKASPQLMLRMRMEMEQKRLEARGVGFEKLEQLRHKVVLAQRQWRELKHEYKRIKRTWAEGSRDKLVQMKAEVALARIEFKKSLAQWSTYVRRLKALPVVA